MPRAAATTGPPREQMIRLAATGTQTPEIPRAEAYLGPGSSGCSPTTRPPRPRGSSARWKTAALAFVDPRVPLARALFLMDKPAEAEALIRQIEQEQPSDPRMCDLVAELLVERSDLTGALGWATAGVELCLGQLGAGWDAGAPALATRPVISAANGDPTELRLLLSLRYRIRNDLGLPEDDYDRLLDELPSGPARPAADS